jgi:hypothetical protein
MLQWMRHFCCHTNSTRTFVALAGHHHYHDNVVYRPVCKRWLSKQRLLLGENHKQTRLHSNESTLKSRATSGNAVYYSVRAEMLQRRQLGQSNSVPCGGGVEYLHRSPASRRRRQKGKSRIWDSKIWDSDPRMTVLARASSSCRGQ